MDYKLDTDEVILYKGRVRYKEESNESKIADFILTSKKMVFEIENRISKGLFKKETVKENIIVELSDIKVFNGEVQCKQKSDEIMVQTNKNNFTISLDGMLEAKKVNSKIIDVITGTTIAQRGSDKVKKAIGLVDDTLGLDTRGMVKGVMENGIKGTLIHGIKKKIDKK